MTPRSVENVRVGFPFLASCSAAVMRERQRLTTIWKSAVKRSKLKEQFKASEMGRPSRVEGVMSDIIRTTVWWIFRRAAPRTCLLVKECDFWFMNFSKARFHSRSLTE